MPDVSRKQQEAMGAAAAGRSTLGIPQKVGAEFIAADKARGPKKLPLRRKHQPGERLREYLRVNGGANGT